MSFMNRAHWNLEKRFSNKEVIRYNYELEGGQVCSSGFRLMGFSHHN